MTVKYFGKRPARRGAIKFQFSSYLTELVKVPATFGHVTNDIRWGMLGNDRAGCCVVAGAGHEYMLWCLATGRPVPTFSEASILREYQAASGWNGRVDDPSDTGLDMQQYAERRRTVGVPDVSGARHRVKSYAAVHGINELLQATYLFGSCGVGFSMPESTSSQFDAGQPWSVVPNSEVVGGHYVPCVGRNSKGNLMFVTWGRLQAATPEFVQRYMDEAVAYVSTSYINPQTGLTPELLDEAKLDADLAALSA